MCILTKTMPQGWNSSKFEDLYFFTWDEFNPKWPFEMHFYFSSVLWSSTSITKVWWNRKWTNKCFLKIYFLFVYNHKFQCNLGQISKKSPNQRNRRYKNIEMTLPKISIHWFSYFSNLKKFTFYFKRKWFKDNDKF